MLKLRVHAGPHPRRACLVSAVVAIDAEQPVTLYQEPGHRPRACQLEPVAGGSRVTWLITQLDAGAIGEYQLVPMLTRRKPPARIRWECLEQSGELLVDGHPQAAYGMREESAFPELQLSGEVSSAVPTRLWLHGRHAMPDHISTVVQDIHPVTAGPVCARVRTAGTWLGTAGQPILDEQMTITAYALPGRVLLFDLALQLRAMHGPLSFAREGESGLLALRWPHARAGNALGGIGREEVDGSRSPWLGLAAVGSLALFDAADNWNSPCRWRWVAADTITADPFSEPAGAFGELAPLMLAAGEQLSLRYRLCRSVGELSTGQATAQYLNYAYPPRVEVIPEG